MIAPIAEIWIIAASGLMLSCLMLRVEYVRLAGRADRR